MHSVYDNQTVLSFPCGGGHRSWDFSYHENRACFVHIKTREVVVSQGKVEEKKQTILKVGEMFTYLMV